jgi:ATP-dependent RNA helicase RhlE
MSFADLQLSASLLRAVEAEGYTIPTPIQLQAIPPALEGRDLLGCAQTGTGKTAAFALPILQRLGVSAGQGRNRDRKIRALILAPTRELADQIGASLQTYGRHTGLRHAVIYGGVSQVPQVRNLRGGVDIVVATPGRLLDLLQQGHVDLRYVEIFVLDEADRMLDMGFIADIRKIVARLTRQRQTMMFSATMPRDIRELADALLQQPVCVQVAPQSSTVEQIDQFVFHVEHRKKAALLEHLLRSDEVTRAVVFARTKHRADRIAKQLHRAGFAAEAIHGNKSQAARQRALEKFRSPRPPVLVATDVAARGLDIDGVSHVFNFDLPNVAETYVHRIGRTGRAGAAGIAISFCDGEERGDLKQIERLIRRSIAVRSDQPKHLASSPSDESAAAGRAPTSPEVATPRPAHAQPRQQHKAYRQPHGKPGFSKHKKKFRSRGQSTHRSHERTVIA